MEHFNKHKIIQECASQFEKLFAPVIAPKIIWNNRMRTTAGRIYFERKNSQYEILYIELNPHLLTDETKLLQTLRHELSHAAALILYKDRGHGRAWRYCMSQLGAEVKRCHQYDTKHLKRRHKRVLAECECQQHSITMIRVKKMQSGVQYKCVKCRTKIKLIA